MKKYILAVLFFLFPFSVDALTGGASITCGNTNLGAGASTNCTLYANITSGSAAGFGGTFQASGVTISNIAVTNTWTGVGASAPVNGMRLNVLPAAGNGLISQSAAVATFTVTAGSSNGSLSFQGQMTDESYNDVGISASQNINILSDNANLSSLSVSAGSLSPAFSPNITEYTMNSDAVNTVVTATAEQGTVSGTGTYNIHYGLNTIYVVVTAPAGNKKTYTISITRKDNRNTDNTLKSITLSDGSINFSPSTYNYNVTLEGNVSSLKVTALANDSKASVAYSPGQTISLGYGQTSTIIITVTAENESKATYKINATRKDNRSSNNNLSSLNVSNTNIKFNGNSAYTTTVENNVTSINISATAQDSKSTVKGTGSKTLKEGSNTFNVSVTAENGSVKTYTITVIRKYKEGTQVNLSTNNNLKTLALNGINFTFDKNVTTYNISVENNVSNVQVHYEVEDSKATASLVGSNELNVGSNKIEVLVVAENGSVKTYTIAITRKDIRSNVANKDDEIIKNLLDTNVVPPIYVNVKDSDENKKVSEKVAEAIVKSKKSIIYEVTNSNNGVIYTIMLDGNTFTSIEPFNYGLKFTTDDDNINKLFKTPYIAAIFDEKAKFESNVKIKLYLGDKIDFIENQLALYSYDTESKTHHLLKGSINYVDGFVEFEAQNLDGFILSKAIIQQEKVDVKEKKDLSWLIFIPCAAGVILLTYFLDKKYKSNK